MGLFNEMRAAAGGCTILVRLAPPALLPELRPTTCLCSPATPYYNFSLKGLHFSLELRPTQDYTLADLRPSSRPSLRGRVCPYGARTNLRGKCFWQAASAS